MHDECEFGAAELPNWLSALAGLTSLVFQVSSLPTGEDNAERLAGLAQLRKLTMRAYHQVDDPLPAGLHGQPHLMDLELRVPGKLGLAGNPAGSYLSRLSALHTVRWHPIGWAASPLPSGILELRSLRSLELDRTTPESLRPGPCWAGLTHLSCRFQAPMATLPPVLSLATSLEHLELGALSVLDAAACDTLAGLPALRRLGVRLVKHRAEALHSLRLACPHLCVYKPLTSHKLWEMERPVDDAEPPWAVWAA